ncbi:hypothetical protein LQ318_13400 [Aliifodinibius salicampi]|uniref:DUF308 domain-containing protein n=1 Tax=Fodinibius salicampi TaxID=1920655 RepID=A0ABT3Q1F0_9BACT|nr:hypothetical protein [Fodinibius salicampi]MCW9713901.1 hypothetical protein [Fodinibius salicampi]
MNTNQKLYQPIAALAFTTVLILLIPLVAMQFTNEVHWTLSDFIFAGGLLFGTGIMYILVTRILATRKAANSAYRVAVGFALFTGLFLIWVNAAVGIIGSEDNPFNVMYFGVIAVGIIGGLSARFQPQGMIRTMFAMALAQALITVIALISGFYQTSPSTLFHIMGVNGFFITLFVVSALLFRYAEQGQIPPNENM